MTRLMQWFLTRRALHMMRHGWDFGAQYGAQVAIFTYRPRRYTKAGFAPIKGERLLPARSKRKTMENDQR